MRFRHKEIHIKRVRLDTAADHLDLIIKTGLGSLRLIAGNQE